MTVPLSPGSWRLFRKRWKAVGALVLLAIAAALLIRFFTSPEAELVVLSRVEVVNATGTSLRDVEVTFVIRKDVWTVELPVLKPGETLREKRWTPDLRLGWVQFSMEGEPVVLEAPGNPCKGRRLVATIRQDGSMTCEWR